MRHAAFAAALALAAPAAADVTPREVWDDWMAALGSGDAETEVGAVEETATGLVVTDFAMRSASEEGSYRLRIDRIALDANADGTVTVKTSPEYPVTLVGRDGDGAEEIFDLRVSHPGLELVASGDGAAERHSYTAPELTVTVAEMTRNGVATDLEAALRFADLAGSYAAGDGADEAGRAGDIAAAAVMLTASGTDPDSEDGGQFEVALRVEDLAATGLTAFLGADMGEVSSSLRDGLERSGTFSYGASTYAIESESGGDALSLSGSAGETEASVGLSADGLRYGGMSRNARATVSGTAVPLPQVEFAVDAAEFDLAIPVLAEEAPQDFAASLRLSGLTLDEGLWNMADPAGIVPRDPAQLTVDLAGQAMIEEDVLGATGDEPPGRIETLRIEELLLAAAGAELSGTGTLTFPEGPGAGATPVGRISLRLVGGNGLIDRLVQAGVIPFEQAMSVRMMLSMFARSGEGADELNSELELTEDGGVLLNGQRVR